MIRNFDVHKLNADARALHFRLGGELLIILRRQRQRFELGQVAQQLHRLVDLAEVEDGDGFELGKEADDELAEVVGDEEVRALAPAADDELLNIAMAVEEGAEEIVDELAGFAWNVLEVAERAGVAIDERADGRVGDRQRPRAL